MEAEQTIFLTLKGVGFFLFISHYVQRRRIPTADGLTKGDGDGDAGGCTYRDAASLCKNSARVRLCNPHAKTL